MRMDYYTLLLGGSMIKNKRWVLMMVWILFKGIVVYLPFYLSHRVCSFLSRELMPHDICEGSFSQAKREGEP